MNGQSGLEFFITFSFLILFLFVSLAVYEQERRGSELFLSKMDAQKVALEFARGVNKVHQCGDGCSYKIYLKDDYALVVRGRVLEVRGNSQLGEAPLVTDRVEVLATPGKLVEVRNINGVVKLHDA